MNMKLVPPTKESIIGKAKKLQGDIQQHFNDVEHWNATHGPADQIDPDPTGEMKEMMAYATMALSIMEKVA